MTSYGNNVTIHNLIAKAQQHEGQPYNAEDLMIFSSIFGQHGRHLRTTATPHAVSDIEIEAAVFSERNAGRAPAYD